MARRLQCNVALKLLHRELFLDDRARNRYCEQAALCTKLCHPNIEIIYEIGSAAGTDFEVKELIFGTMLGSTLEARSLSEKEIRRLGVQLAQGLAAAHEQV